MTGIQRVHDSNSHCEHPPFWDYRIHTHVHKPFDIANLQLFSVLLSIRIYLSEKAQRGLGGFSYLELTLWISLEFRKGHSLSRLDSSLRWNDKHSYTEFSLEYASQTLSRHRLNCRIHPHGFDAIPRLFGRSPSAKHILASNPVLPSQVRRKLLGLLGHLGVALLRPLGNRVPKLPPPSL